MFGVTDGDLKGPNIQTVNWRTEQGAFLTGVVAARMTKTKVVGYIGGMDYPDIVRVGEAFKLGALHVDPTIKAFRMYLGSWHDQAIAYETATAMADKGVDVFLHIADVATPGIIKLIKERNLMVIGVNHYEQVNWAPKATTAVLAHGYENLFERNFQDVESGDFGNKIINYGLENGWEQILLVEENLPIDVVDEVRMVQRDIACGKITVPIIIKPTD
jgi:basic membrane lipoprotein Med (substrate-binding protein (PBP1-ABC) superfamily)